LFSENSRYGFQRSCKYAKCKAVLAKKRGSSILTLGVILAALDYFVDIYDLVLFSVVRVSSLRSIGVSGQALVDQGALLCWGSVNIQRQLTERKPPRLSGY
jgi:hypothetical protein